MFLGACGSEAPITFDVTTPTTTPVASNPTDVTAGAATSTMLVASSVPLIVTTSSPDPAATSAPAQGTTDATSEVNGHNTLPPTFAPPTTMPAPSDTRVVPYPLFAVPQLGTEPVQGSGCGRSQDIGDTMPDGLWFGYAELFGTALTFDIVCVYSGQAAVERGAVGDASEFFAQNESDRIRLAERAPGFVARRGSSIDGVCVDPGSAGDVPVDTLVNPIAGWVTVAGGVATSMVSVCIG